VFAKRRAAGRMFCREHDPKGYWPAIVACTLLAVMLLCVS